MGREPGWRGPDESDWGLSTYRWNARFADSIRGIPRIIEDLALWASYPRTRRILRRIDRPKLALGSGTTTPDGWYGLDLYRNGPRVRRADLLMGIPALTGTVGAILAEHILEHLYLDDVPRVLAECRRVLCHGGIVRVVSPDAMQVARLLRLGVAGEDDPVVMADIEMHRWDSDGLRWARTVNRLSHQWGQHRCLLTGELIARLLIDSGFHGVEVLPVLRTRYLEDGPPDIHPKRFPNEVPASNFAVEALAM